MNGIRENAALSYMRHGCFLHILRATADILSTVSGAQTRMLFLALAGIATASAAGEDRDVFAGWSKPGPPPLERFIEPLDLTAEQQRKLAPIFVDAQARAAQDAAKAGAADKPPAEQVHDQMVVRESDFRTRLAAVLTPDQMARYAALAEGRTPATRTQIPHPAHGHGAMEHSTPGVTPGVQEP